LSVEVVGFEQLKDEYPICLDFGGTYASLSSDQHIMGEYVLKDDFLFKGDRLCIPRMSLLEFLIWELHLGGIAGHFGRDKTIALVEDRFYWPNLKRDVAKVLGRCRTCQLA
ncbi:integrase zinc binding domain-containing protein, partial [Mycobacterium kansasii]